jgi:predicted secreted acid phosphatase
MMLLSNGEKIYGMMSHTQRKPVRIWVEEQKQYKDIPFALIRSIDAQVIWERQEKEWHFKESGSDIKEYSGKEYPARDTQYQITLKNRKVITGAVDEPIYLATKDGNVTFILHKRDKGELGQTLDELVYVKHVEFDDAVPATQP